MTSNNLRDRIATIVRESMWSQNHDDLPDTPGEVADAILAACGTQSLTAAVLAEVGSWSPDPRGEGDNGGWGDGWHNGFNAGREWAAGRVRSVLAGEDER